MFHKLQKRADEKPLEGAAPQNGEKCAEVRKKSENAVLVYVIVLFSVVLALIILSYFIQQRRNSDAISSLNQQHTEFTNQANQNIEDLQNKNQELTKQLAESEAKLAESEKKTDELQTELDNAKKDWAADVKTVTDTLKTDYNKELQHATALETLLHAEISLQDGDVVSAKKYLDQLAIQKDSLGSDWLAEYEKLRTQVGTDVG